MAKAFNRWARLSTYLVPSQIMFTISFNVNLLALYITLQFKQDSSGENTPGDNYVL